MIGLYFDEHMHRTVGRALIQLGISVVMAVDAGMTGKTDEDHLAYATVNKLVMVTFDHPFAGRSMNRSDF
jgi:predicted nuclease of predicted toxin-antitoxin system